MIICHIGPPTGAFRDPRGTQNGPKRHKMAQNHQKWRSWANKAQIGPSGPQTVLKDITHDYIILAHPWGH